MPLQRNSKLIHDAKYQFDERSKRDSISNISGFDLLSTFKRRYGFMKQESTGHIKKIKPFKAPLNMIVSDPARRVKKNNVAHNNNYFSISTNGDPTDPCDSTYEKKYVTENPFDDCSKSVNIADDNTRTKCTSTLQQNFENLYGSLAQDKVKTESSNSNDYKIFITPKMNNLNALLPPLQQPRCLEINEELSDIVDTSLFNSNVSTPEIYNLNDFSPTLQPDFANTTMFNPGESTPSTTSEDYSFDSWNNSPHTETVFENNIDNIFTSEKQFNYCETYFTLFKTNP